MLFRGLGAGLGLAGAVSGAAIAIRQQTGSLEACPGYSASNVQTTTSGLTADLSLAGPACNAYGTDIQDLTLAVNYDSGTKVQAASFSCQSLT